MKIGISIPLGVAVVLIGSVIIIGLVFLDIFEVMQDNIMYIQCCDGNPCSDTYYTPEDNKCHLVLCENNPLIINKSKCVYEGANISIEAMS